MLSAGTGPAAIDLAASVAACPDDLPADGDAGHLPHTGRGPAG